MRKNMEISVEISYFPLTDNHLQPVDDFIAAITKSKKVKIEPGIMSSLLTGPYDEIMKLLHCEMKPFMEKYPSIFTLKLSNSCSVCEVEEA